MCAPLCGMRGPDCPDIRVPCSAHTADASSRMMATFPYFFSRKMSLSPGKQTDENLKRRSTGVSETRIDSDGKD